MSDTAEMLALPTGRPLHTELLDPEAPAAHCSCGREYTLAEWRRLPTCGEALDGFASLVMMRHCACGSTLCLPAWRDAGDEQRRPADRRRAAIRRLELVWLMAPGGRIEPGEALRLWDWIRAWDAAMVVARLEML